MGRSDDERPELKPIAKPISSVCRQLTPCWRRRYQHERTLIARECSKGNRTPLRTRRAAASRRSSVHSARRFKSATAPVRSGPRSRIPSLRWLPQSLLNLASSNPQRVASFPSQPTVRYVCRNTAYAKLDGCRRVSTTPLSNKPPWSPQASQPDLLSRANNSRYGPSTRRSIRL